MSKASKVLIGGVAAVVLIAVALGIWWFASGSAPEKPSLESATAAAKKRSSGGEASADDAELDGEWVIQADSGAADLENETGTFAGFRVDEELANIGAKTAVGRTTDVSGSMKIEGSEVTGGEFTVNLSTLTSDNNMRDSRVRQALDTDAFPDAKLKLTGTIPLPGDATSGATVAATVPGELSVKGKTKKVELAIESRYVEGQIVVVGSTPITFSDFDVEVPKSPVVLSVKDHGEMEFQALMNRR